MSTEQIMKVIFMLSREFVDKTHSQPHFDFALMALTC